MRKSALKTINADIYEIEARILELLARVGSEKSEPPALTVLPVLGLTQDDKEKIEKYALSSLSQIRLLSAIINEKLQDKNWKS